MQEFEKMGVFYLGKEYDVEQKKLDEDFVLYKSKDLTTHGVIIGMTGSGKTGLGIGIIEEAAMDNIPVIAIDPKGDIGNLKLTFPELNQESFRPFINLYEAENKGFTLDEYAKNQANLWQKGLADWGQGGKRIETLRCNADINIYTPGSSSGIPVSVLGSFEPPNKEVLNDKEAYNDKIQITTTSLLSLVGVNGDTLISREHILISNILSHFWDKEESIDLAGLIKAIQNPPTTKVGVMDLESFYPSKDRFTLAMSFNNLLASPSFSSWLEGEPLNVKNFLYTEEGKPKVSVFTISHFSESERMFFVTMLLNEILSWVRTQPGTSSLRAILYMDEIFGYLPPTANPPSKTPLLTLLKQARAYGLGLLLSTQNPVDLDYKALSNCGTWFIGRLQTQRDKDRVLAGLEGVATGGKFDKKRTEQILAGLDSRVFYLHNVHQDEPVIFHTRWTMSYLAGPLTRKQIIKLTEKKAEGKSDTKDLGKIQTSQPTSKDEASKPSSFETQVEESTQKGAQGLAQEIGQVYLPIHKDAGNITYSPLIIGVAEVFYNSAKNKVAETKTYTIATEAIDGPISLDWSKGQIIDLEIGDLANEASSGAVYEELPSPATNPKNYDKWKKLLSQHVRKELPLSLLRSPSLKENSKSGEGERDFRIRIQHLAHEYRDKELEKLRKKYNKEEKTLEERLRKAVQKVEKQNSQADQKKVDAAVNIGSAVLGALFGRKVASRSSVSKFGTALKSTNRAMKSGESVEQAEETVESIELQIANLQNGLKDEVKKITEKYDIQDEELEVIEIRPTANNITVHYIGLAWNPRE